VAKRYVMVKWNGQTKVREWKSDEIFPSSEANFSLTPLNLKEENELIITVDTIIHYPNGDVIAVVNDDATQEETATVFFGLNSYSAAFVQLTEEDGWQLLK
jgi:hypothetical protein